MARLWAEVIELINFRLQLTLLASPELVLLGFQDDELSPRYTKILLSYLFFMLREKYT